MDDLEQIVKEKHQQVSSINLQLMKLRISRVSRAGMGGETLHIFFFGPTVLFHSFDDFTIILK